MKVFDFKAMVNSSKVLSKKNIKYLLGMLTFLGEGVWFFTSQGQTVKEMKKAGWSCVKKWLVEKENHQRMEVKEMVEYLKEKEEEFSRRKENE